MKKYLILGFSLIGFLLLAAGGYETVNTISSIQYYDIIRRVKKDNFLDDVPDALTLATIETESSFNPDAIREEPQINDASYGLMQILYGTAQEVGYNGTPEGLFDPATNILYATKYHQKLFRRFNAWDAVIHAYNEGPGNYAKGKRVPTYYGRVAARMAKWETLLAAQGEISG